MPQGALTVDVRPGPDCSGALRLLIHGASQDATIILEPTDHPMQRLAVHSKDLHNHL